MPTPDPDDDAPDVTAPDDLSALFTWLADRLDPDDMSQAEELITNLVNSFGGPNDDDDMATDSKGRKMINRETIRELQAIREAEAETGILGMDSAYATYAAALRARGHDTRGLAGSTAAIRQVFRMTRGQPQRAMGMDSARATARSAMFPNGDRLSKRYG